ncbi:hypothetical protein F4225_02605 [Candidatus Poribacteria bacterium]|nr:hypothetical protein [Candidatus Poribacteria bacterium]
MEVSLYAVILENLKASTEEDIDAYLDTIHSDSPTYQQTEQLTKQMFEIYDVKYETHVFRYVCRDGDYAIGRFEFSTIRVAGPGFQDNRLDTFHIFCKENDQWQIWGQVTLTAKYL